MKSKTSKSKIPMPRKQPVPKPKRQRGRPRVEERRERSLAMRFSDPEFEALIARYNQYGRDGEPVSSFCRRAALDFVPSAPPR